MNHYIAFLDLLGTKAIAISNPLRYREVIECFHEAISHISEKYAELEMYVFSDCAYLQENNILRLCLFLKELREQLLFEGICFNSAVCEGELNTKVSNKGNTFSIIDFESEQVVKVYRLQSCFSGAGIYIDTDLLCDEKTRNELNGITVKSIYESVNKFDGKIAYSNCYDVKFQVEAIELLKYILNLYFKCWIWDKRAARYYYTLYATYIAEQAIDIFLKNDMMMICEIINLARQIEIEKDKMVIIMLLINRLYEAEKERHDKKYEYSKINENLNDPLRYIYESANLENLFNIKEIDSKIINENNMALFADFCFEIR